MKVLDHHETQKNPYVKHQKDLIYFDKKYALLELKYTKLEVQNHGNLQYLLRPVNGCHKALSLLDYRHPYPFERGQVQEGGD